MFFSKQLVLWTATPSSLQPSMCMLSKALVTIREGTQAFAQPFCNPHAVAVFVPEAPSCWPTAMAVVRVPLVKKLTVDAPTCTPTAMAIARVPLASELIGAAALPQLLSARSADGVLGNGLLDLWHFRLMPLKVRVCAR